MQRILCTAVVVCGFAGAAAADRIDLFIFENADNADTSGLDLWVDVVDRGSYADFIFHNDSSVSSFVRSIYIEGTDFSENGLTGERIENPQPLGVDFEEGATPHNPPGAIANFGGAWQGNLFDVGANRPGSGKDGIDAGEHLVLQFDYDGITHAELVAALGGDEPLFRIVQHVQGLDGGYSVWGKNGGGERVVPLPSGAGLALAGLGLVGVRRRR